MTFTPTKYNECKKYVLELMAKNKVIEVKPTREKKTLSQNNYIWLVFTHIGYETGNTKDDMYKYFLDKFPFFKTIYVGGTEANIQLTLSAFSKEQTSFFIESLTADARIEGFDVPDPEDKKAADMYNYYRELGYL